MPRREPHQATQSSRFGTDFEGAPIRAIRTGGARTVSPSGVQVKQHTRLPRGSPQSPLGPALPTAISPERLVIPRILEWSPAVIDYPHLCFTLPLTPC